MSRAIPYALLCCLCAAIAHVRAAHAVAAAAATQGDSSARQEPAPAVDEAQRVAAALRVLRDRRASDEDRATAMDELLTLGCAGPEALARELELELTRLRRVNGRAEARVLARFAKVAPKVAEARLDRAALADVAAQRRVVLDNAADSALSKETIHSASDPAYARLEELLNVSTNQVFDADEALFEQWVTLLDELDRELALHERWAAAQRALAAQPAGERSAARLRAPERPERDAAAVLAEGARLAELATPMSERDRATFTANVALVTAGEFAAEFDAEEARGIHALNRRRVLLGLPAQRIDPKLCRACRTHSRDMVEGGFFAHDSPVAGRETPWKRAAEAGTSASAENIAAGASTGPDTILQWWYSPGHHRNMLGGGDRTGLGRFESHWTQLFGD